MEIRIVVIAGYALLFLELVLCSVPSSASYGRTRRWPHAVRNAVIVVGLLLPLAWAIAPDLSAFLVLGRKRVAGPYVAGTLFLGGQVIGVWSAALLRTAGRRRARGLVTKGPYRWSRNPILISIYLRWIAILLLVPSLVSAAALLFCTAHMHFRVIREERDLRRRFGPRYRAYAAVVPRYFM